MGHGGGHAHTSPRLFGSVCIERSSSGDPATPTLSAAVTPSGAVSFHGVRCCIWGLPLATLPLTVQGGHPAGRCWCQGVAVCGCGAPRPLPWWPVAKWLGQHLVAAGRSRAGKGGKL